MSDSVLKAPQSPPSWSHTPEAVLSITKDTLEKTRKLHDQIAAIPPSERSYETVILPLATREAAVEAIMGPLSFYQNVSASKELRDASNEAEGLLRDFNVEASMRVDVFEAIKSAAESIEKTGKELAPEEKRLVDKMLLEGKRAGLDLPEEKRNELTELKKELSQTCLEFSKNFNEENGKIAFNLKELNGVPSDVVSGYKKLPAEGDNPELYEVTFKMPDIMPLFKFATNPETRRRASAGFENRLAINEPLLKKGLALRRKIAKLLGYKTWGDYVTEVNMVKNANNVFAFLNDVAEKLKSVAAKDKEVHLALKKAEHEERGYPFDGEFYLWDYDYYNRLFVEKSLSLDESLIKEYFPVSVVVETIMEVYQDLLSVKFLEITGETWHPDVQQFSVWEKDAKDESGFLGYCYLDLFPREGKFSHAAMWTLVPGHERTPKGDRNYPVAAMVANLAKATPEKPALMSHGDAVMFFHEMGHVFHALLSKTKFSRFHGTAGVLDFAEAPSQMLENWCWEPKMLRKITSHYKTGEPLSEELIDNLVKSRYTNVGLFYLRQVFMSTFDMKVHTDQEDQEYTKLWNDMRESISLVKGDKEIYPAYAALGHLMNGYDAGLYSYMYSLVFAADMYATVFKKDPFSPELGKLYRDNILLPGASKDESELLKAFLGREPTSDAFLHALFGDSAPNTD